MLLSGLFDLGFLCKKPVSKRKRQTLRSAGSSELRNPDLENQLLIWWFHRSPPLWGTTLRPKNQKNIWFFRQVNPNFWGCFSGSSFFFKGILGIYHICWFLKCFQKKRCYLPTLQFKRSCNFSSVEKKSLHFTDAPWVHGGIGRVQERFNPIPQKLRGHQLRTAFTTHIEDKDCRQGTLLDHLDERHWTSWVHHQSYDFQWIYFRCLWNTRLHPSGPPSSSLTDSWPAHIKAAKIPRITSCHIIWQLFGGNASWPWCPLCFLGKTDTQKPQGIQWGEKPRKGSTGDI